MPHRSTLPLLCALTLACGRDPQLPEVVAASKYIDYGTWADTTDLCMDDRLAAWDRYIEKTSAFLGIDPPAQRILYIWVPEAQQDDGTWGCPPGATGCAVRTSAGYQSLVFAGRTEMLHELVHAVETPAFGRTHKVFSEGMAEYLSEFAPTYGQPGFPAAFVEMVDRVFEGRSDYYRSMHFVGSLLERDGIEKYQAFRLLLPPVSGFAEFTAAYAQVYGQDLSEALAAMEGGIHGQGPWLCDEIVGEPIEADGSRALLLAGECGDGDFFNPGFEAGELGASKNFMLHVTVGGYYEMTLRGEGAPSMPYSLEISSCPGSTPSAASTSSGHPTTTQLFAGSYRLQVWYPGGLAGAATLDLKLVEPSMTSADPSRSASE